MLQVHHCSNLYYIPVQGQLAKWLVSNSCADKASVATTNFRTNKWNSSSYLLYQAFFCNSGAEANEAAIKLARKYAHTKLQISSPVIITAISSFHGRTLTAITATGQEKYQKNFGPLTPGFEYVEYNNIQKLKVFKPVNMFFVSTVNCSALFLSIVYQERHFISSKTFVSITILLLV